LRSATNLQQKVASKIPFIEDQATQYLT